tara:strand:+ start:1765 stop:2475 length:711 start_codon:yes stop_codon:yes gene_type:complete
MSDSKIAIVMPTRNRPEKLERFINSVVDTAEDLSRVNIYLYVDADDVVTMPKVTELSDKYPSLILCLVGPRTIHSHIANLLLPYVKEDIFFLGADDLIMRTKGWDKVICDFFDNHEDKVVLAYGDDLFQPNLATHPILHRNWVEAIGYLTPFYFEADFADTWINDLAHKINRKQKLDFVNEHMHFFARKMELDQTFAENRNRYKNQDPELVYKCLEPVRQRDAQKLLNVMESLKNA